MPFGWPNAVSTYSESMSRRSPSKEPTLNWRGRALGCRFSTWDFLAAAPPGGPFQFVFDRGCFHVFDEPGERQRFTAQVAAALAPDGLWLSLIGSTEGPPRAMSVRRAAPHVRLRSPLSPRWKS